MLMTVIHALYDLLEKPFGSFFIELAHVFYIFQKLAALEKLHYYGDLHVLQGQAIVNFDYVLVVERFQNLGFDENTINVTDRPDILSFYDFYSEILARLLVLSQKYTAEAAFSQFLPHLILPKETAGIKLITFGGIQNGLILDILEIVFVVFCAIGVEEPEVVIVDDLLDVIEGEFLVGDDDFVGFLGGLVRVVDINLVMREILSFLRLSFRARTQEKTSYSLNNMLKKKNIQNK